MKEDRWPSVAWICIAVAVVSMMATLVSNDWAKASIAKATVQAAAKCTEKSQ